MNDIFVLTPTRVVEKCLLEEALYWVGLNRYPTEFYGHDGDARFDSEFQSGDYHARMPHELCSSGVFTNEECKAMGLPPHPEYQSLLGEEEYLVYFGHEYLEAISSRQDIPEDYKIKLKGEQLRAFELSEKQAEWDELYEEFIEASEARLFLSLKEGKLKAYGRKLPDISPDELVEQKDSSMDDWSWMDYQYEEIPSNFWRLSDISWSGSSSFSNGGHYIHIYVMTDNLLSLFPPIDKQIAFDVSIVGAQYVVYPSSEHQNTVVGQRGRPEFDWKSFHVEIARRVKEGELPEKQEACIADMQVWCSQNWGKTPGRSTLLQKITPYYDIFVRK